MCSALDLEFNFQTSKHFKHVYVTTAACTTVINWPKLGSLKQPGHARTSAAARCMVHYAHCTDLYLFSIEFLCVECFVLKIPVSSSEPVAKNLLHRSLTCKC